MQFNSKTYSLDSLTSNAATYSGPQQSLSLRDQLVLSRQRIKTAASYSGNSRGNATLARTVSLTNAATPTGVAALACDNTIPVGTSSADVDVLIADFRGFVASDEFATWVKSRAVNY